MTSPDSPLAYENRKETSGSGPAHLNEITVIGELAGPVRSRTLPSGDEVMSFRVTVCSRAARTSESGKGSAPLRTDGLDCAAWRTTLRIRLERCQVGDLLQVNGSLRHRSWRGPAGLGSRYEIEADRIRVVRRAARGSPPSPRAATNAADSSITPDSG